MKNNVFGEINLEDNLVIIGPSYIKKEILNECNLKYNIKFFSIEELKEKYLYKYKDDTLVYLDTKYNLIPEVGKIILSYLYEVEVNNTYSTSKLNDLINIKKDLIDSGYIIYDKHFRRYLTSKKIIVLDDGFNSLFKKVISDISKENDVTLRNVITSKKEELDIYEFNSLEEEVIFLATKISELVKSGISLNKIKLNTIDAVYKSSINRVFNFFNIPFDINNNNKLFYLDDIKLFLNSIEDDMKILSINELLNDLKIEDKIKVKLVNILNKYTDYEIIKEIKEELIYDLKNTSIKFDKYTNVVEEIDYKSYYPKDDEYVFMLGFNQDKVPRIYKDDKYLLDLELEEIGSDTSFNRNSLETNKLNNFLFNTENLTISYKLSSNFMEFSPSNYIKELSSIIKVNIVNDSYNYKNEIVNKLMLASSLDNYIKYNVINDNLHNLYSSYSDIDYNSYNNNYNGINYETIKRMVDNKLNLSFSNTNTFFKCKFRFLLETIYKLTPSFETVSQKIGTLFHEVLCIVYRDKVTDYDKVVDKVIEKMYQEPTKKDLYYLSKYRQALKKLINVLNDEIERSSYENSYFEEWFSIDKPGDLKISIVGKIDKILTLKDDTNTYVIVVDYKTGSLHNDFNKVIYGLDMQLLYYLYLIKNTSKISNPKFTGMYLQSIMTEVLASQDGKAYEDLVSDNMKLSGYTIDNLQRLYEIDNNYENGSYIKGIKVKNDGTFYAYSKVLTEETIDVLIDIVDKNINEVIDSIKKVDFAINPKKLGDTNVGCEYCAFGDICYMNENNIVKLKEYKDLEFLGGDTDDSN